MIESISYKVLLEDWLPINSGKFDENDWEITVPSKVDHDIRMSRCRTFDSEEEAVNYANQVLENRKDDQWLASVEIVRVTTEIILKYK